MIKNLITLLILSIQVFATTINLKQVEVFEDNFKYEFIIKIIIAIFIIIVIFLYRQYILNKHKKILQVATNEIKRITIQLSKQKLLFETL